MCMKTSTILTKIWLGSLLEQQYGALWNWDTCKYYSPPKLVMVHPCRVYRWSGYGVHCSHTRCMSCMLYCCSRRLPSCRFDTIMYLCDLPQVTSLTVSLCGFPNRLYMKKLQWSCAWTKWLKRFNLQKKKHIFTKYEQETHEFIA